MDRMNVDASGPVLTHRPTIYWAGQCAIFRGAVNFAEDDLLVALMTAGFVHDPQHRSLEDTAATEWPGGRELLMNVRGFEETGGAVVRVDAVIFPPRQRGPRSVTIVGFVLARRGLCDADSVLIFSCQLRKRLRVSARLPITIDWGSNAMVISEEYDPSPTPGPLRGRRDGAPGEKSGGAADDRG